MESQGTISIIHNIILDIFIILVPLLEIIMHYPILGNHLVFSPLHYVTVSFFNE